MKKFDLVSLSLIILVVLLCFAAIRIYYNNTHEIKVAREGNDPFGQPCIKDSDCNCTLTCPDCCGKIGQIWKCKEEKCQLGFFKD